MKAEKTDHVSETLVEYRAYRTRTVTTIYEFRLPEGKDPYEYLYSEREGLDWSCCDSYEDVDVEVEKV